MSALRGLSRWLSCLLALLLAAPTFGQGNAAQVGRWDPPKQWPIVGIHAAVLPTGEVFNLTYVDEATELLTAATVWNPVTGKFRDVSPGFGDMFCSGQNFLPSGELFVAGGYGGLFPGKCEAQGVTPTYSFNPFNLTWRSTGNMRFPRFYPTVIALGEGKQLIIGGQGENCQYIPVMELFDPAKGLSRVTGPNKLMKDYPRIFLLSDGSLVHVAPEFHTDILDGGLESWSPLTFTRLLLDRWEAAAFYVPGQQDRIMLCGGYTTRVGTDLDDPTATCEVSDPLVGKPSWRPAASMHQARGDLNAVLLPDGNVLAVGGGSHHRYEGPDLRPEIYDTARNTWTVMAPQRYGRMYHATAVLLPDGRVLSSGQDDDGSGDGEISGAWGEVFSPPYLFRGARPSITSAPASAVYGSTLDLTVSQASSIRSLVLMGLSSVTHSTNVGQRYVPLAFSRPGGAKLRAQVTDNPNLAPPGYYMLFAVNNKGVPSVARMILLTADAGTTCFKLTRTRKSKPGGDDPTAVPTMSPECSAEEEYLAGTDIELTARPNTGWEVARWIGTDDDNATLEVNRLTMPAADHTVTVDYDRIATSFTDSFEDEDFCTWIGRECKDCAPASCHMASQTGPLTSALGSTDLDSKASSRLERSGEEIKDGNYSLKTVYEAGSKGNDFLIDTTPARSGGESRYEVGFWIRPESGLRLKGTNTLILQANEINDHARTIFEVFLKPRKGVADAYSVTVRGRTDAGSKVNLTAVEIAADEWQHLRIEWHAASPDGAAGGRIAVYLGETLAAEATLANSSMLVDELRFGQVKGKKKPTRGVVFFDLVESSWGQ